ncbi:NUDIX hydrolase [Streptomyces griseoviridis]|uniref:NUDIX domain-containing protein n=2 Tax=Streptomyces TaxID=1883 RepID=A0A3S9ZMW3_STRGD|nr:MULTISPECIES: NUDIX domain-containing protein [Streptomyces]AZS89029.1 NUDIX domain-containing protein [Streptomyces griseoviridis]MDH6697706.1 8-oxo-dGTP pyrophosphatase MutT (NUDIX family) [Streptomyces sp. MAA16]MDT0472368.1 NUDIX domain-containing protein [Streptomyces sp. DSM 41014]QCN84122.1 NUDIX hydrolase [Streptomyces griseoviridis]
MATPDFIREIRAFAGHELLWLPGVSAVVFDDEGRVLLGQRADNHRWALISGIPDPGEQPATAIAREVEEETGVVVDVERLITVRSGREVTFPNGDRCQFMDLCFRCRAVSGEARVNDDESLAVAWFALDELPELADFHRFRIKQALSDEPAWFEAPGTE